MLPTLLIDLAIAPIGAVDADLSFLGLFIKADWVVRTVMIVLTLASVWTWVIAIDKGIQFYLLRKRATLFEETFWSGRTLDDLQSGLGTDVRDPMARVFTAAMREYRESQGGLKTEGSILSTRERIDRVMDLVVNRELAKAESGMTVLATIGSAAVFIGLFGTVWGIMNAFRAIAASQNTNLAVVAPGIAEALFATALGLVAAIPAVIFYNLYSAKLEKYGGRLEGYADELGAILSRKLNKAA